MIILNYTSTTLAKNPALPLGATVVPPGTQVTAEQLVSPYSGQVATLQPTAVAVYDSIKGAEMLANQMGIDDGGHELWKTVREGLDWFIKHYPEEYMVLLD